MGHAGKIVPPVRDDWMERAEIWKKKPQKFLDEPGTFFGFFQLKNKLENVNVYILWIDFTNDFSSSIISYSDFHLIYVKSDDAFVQIAIRTDELFLRDAYITYIG